MMLYDQSMQFTVDAKKISVFLNKMLGYILTCQMYKERINTYQSNTKHANLIPGHIMYVLYATVHE